MFFEKTSDAELEAELIPLLRKRAMALRAVDLARQLTHASDQNYDQVRERLGAVEQELERRYDAAAAADPNQPYQVPPAPSLTLEES